MNPSKSGNPLKSLLNMVPKSVPLDTEPVEITMLQPGRSMPLLVKAVLDFVELPNWLAGNRELIENKLYTHGGILFRGFAVHQIQDFEKVFYEVCRFPVEYTQRTSPRTAVTKHTYTSTDYPADQVIHMHNESSYSANWPLKISFFCMKPASKGGETPIADVRQVAQHVKQETLQKFEERQVLYVRNMQEGIGLSWQEVYQTSDKRTVEAYLEKEGISYEWYKEGKALKVQWVRPAFRIHPITQEKLWFNHAFFYNKYMLDPELVKVVPEESLPFATYYGDGTSIEEAVINEIKEAFEQSICLFQWEKGDILLLDNMLVSHGRRPFEGERKVFVAMGDPIHNFNQKL